MLRDFTTPFLPSIWQWAAPSPLPAAQPLLRGPDTGIAGRGIAGMASPRHHEKEKFCAEEVPILLQPGHIFFLLILLRGAQSPNSPAASELCNLDLVLYSDFGCPRLNRGMEHSGALLERLTWDFLSLYENPREVLVLPET